MYYTVSMDQDTIQKLQTHQPKFCSLATASLKGDPQVAIMAYAVDERGHILFSTDTGSRKYANAKENPQAAVAIGWQHDGVNFQIEGTLSFVMENDDGYLATQDLYYGQNPHLVAFKSLPNHAFIILKPTWIRVNDYTKQPRETHEFDLA